MKSNGTILLEFNELTPSLLDRFIASGVLPNFARFRSEARTFTTHADEREPYLEPWIQWVTVHTGLNYSDHGVFHLDEGHKLRAKRVWDIVCDHGMKAWVCGSMNVRYGESLNGAVVPDPWCTQIVPTPLELGQYFHFVQKNVLEHTNDNVPLTKSQYLQFLRFMASHGLSASTITSIVKQLAGERFGDTRWRRAVLLDLLQLDVFVHYYKRFRPEFSTFFLNSTAYYQHAYWESMEPEAFGRPTPEVDSHRDAVAFGYKRMDAILGRMMQLAGKHATIIFCTALSQQPDKDYGSHAGVFYRPKDFGTLAAAAGITGPYSVAPVMTEQFHLEFQTTSAAAAAEQKLKAITLGGGALMATQLDGVRLFAGCNLHMPVAGHATLTLPSGRSMAFSDMFYQIQTAKTSIHHPDVVLWIRTPDRRHVPTTSTVPLASVAPTILAGLGISVPAHMKERALAVA
jgi:hypothetical protein